MPNVLSTTRPGNIRLMSETGQEVDCAPFPLGLVPATLQGTIIVDPQNVSGFANDLSPQTKTLNIAGASLKGPVYASYRGVCNTWGSTRPLLNTPATQLPFISGHVDDTDPVIFEPIVTANASVIMQGLTTPVASNRNVTGVVAKARATGQLLNVNAGAGPAANQLLINQTKGYRAWLNALVGGTTFSVSQALAPQAAGVFAFPAEVDTTANNDLVSVVTLTPINVAKFAPVMSTVGGGLVSLYQCTVFDPGGAPGSNAFELGMNVLVQECLINRIVCWDGRAGFDSLLLNCNCQGGINGGTASQGSYFAIGGILAGPVDTTGFDLTLDGDVLVNSALFDLHGSGANGAILGLVFLATGTTLNTFGLAIGASNYGTLKPVIWGGGTLNVNGRLVYPTGQTAVNTFLQAGGLQMNGQANAFSTNAANPTATIAGGIAITPANLDAAQSNVGFGGKAFNMFSGASIQQTNGF